MPCYSQDNAPEGYIAKFPDGPTYESEEDCLDACAEGACCETDGTCNIKPQCECDTDNGAVFAGVGEGCEACAKCCGYFEYLARSVQLPEGHPPNPAGSEWRNSFYVSFGTVNTDRGPDRSNGVISTWQNSASELTGLIQYSTAAQQVQGDGWLFALIATTSLGSGIYGLSLVARCNHLNFHQNQNPGITITLGSRIAKTIKHTALDGSVTTWNRTQEQNALNQGINIFVPIGDFSQYFTGTYSVEEHYGTPFGDTSWHQPLESIAITLKPGAGQLLSTIDLACNFPNPLP